ncbi:MAG: hypothetical protein AAFP84_00065 [Actinomycetota bacterium]
MASRRRSVAAGTERPEGATAPIVWREQREQRETADRSDRDAAHPEGVAVGPGWEMWDSRADDVVPAPGRRGWRRAVVPSVAVVAFAGGAFVLAAGGGTESETADPDVRSAESAAPRPTILVTLPPARPAAPIDAGADAPADLSTDGTTTILTVPPIEAGLRVGGMGGGADLRVAPGRTAPVVDELALARLPRLPTSIDTVRWMRSIVDTTFDDGHRPQIEVVAGTAVVTARSTDGGSVVAAFGVDDGELAWREVVPDSRRIDIVGRTDEAVVLRIRRERSADDVLVDVRTGASVPLGSGQVEMDATSVAVPEVGTRPPDEALEIARSAAVVASIAAAVELAARLDAEPDDILRADEVAPGRFVLRVGTEFIGARLRVRDDEGGVGSVGREPTLVIEWRRDGVLLGSTPSDRGATLLVSDLEGRRQQAVDADTGRTIAELAPIAASVDEYTATADGIVLKRPSVGGTERIAIGLDGAERWRLPGDAPLAIGDGVALTATVESGRLVVRART